MLDNLEAEKPVQITETDGVRLLINIHAANFCSFVRYAVGSYGSTLRGRAVLAVRSWDARRVQHLLAVRSAWASDQPGGAKRKLHAHA